MPFGVRSRLGEAATTVTGRSNTVTERSSTVTGGAATTVTGRSNTITGEAAITASGHNHAKTPTVKHGRRFYLSPKPYYALIGLYFGTRVFIRHQAMRYATAQKQNTIM